MIDGNKVIDFGTVQIHKKALAEVVYFAVTDLEGVHFRNKNFFEEIMELFGYKYFPGITINLEANEEIGIEVKVFIRYGLNIPEMANQIQETIKMVLGKIVNMHLIKIDVHILGVERGAK